MNKNLLADFSIAEEELDGVWMTSLNFETMYAEFEKNDIHVRLHQH